MPYLSATTVIADSALLGSASPLMWGAFTLLVLVLLALDLGLFNRKDHEITIPEALRATVFWIALAMIFNAWVYYQFGQAKAVEFLTGYVIEKALSVDNLFVFLLLFGMFKVPKAMQHRVLFYGILGAIVMRAIFIGLGAVIISKFGWVMYIFGAFLLYTGIKLLMNKEGDDKEEEENKVVAWLQKILPTTPHYHGSKFWVKEAGKWVATPLFIVLVAIEISDLVFAVDSIPAIFGITLDPFIVYTSNIFAILGLRSLYFVLARAMDKFSYLHYGLGIILVFIGVKMLILMFGIHIPPMLSLAIVLSCLAISMILSLVRPPAPKPAETATFETNDEPPKF